MGIIHRNPGTSYKRVPTADDAGLPETSKAPIGGVKAQQGKGLSYYKRDDTRFDLLKAEVPWREITLAVGLMLFGLLSFIMAWMHVTQEILGKEKAEFGFTLLGLLTFLPGFHHTRIAYYAWRGVKGYTFDHIPHS